MLYLKHLNNLNNLLWFQVLINIFKLHLVLEMKMQEQIRSPGEFYQLDLEMSFVEQEDVFNVVEKLLVNTFKKFSNKKLMFDKFPKISYADAMLKYGVDKPDLRNPLIIMILLKFFQEKMYHLKFLRNL